MPHLVYFERIISVFAFVLGAIVGSFLNVCIYRLPLGLSVNEPRRSFCPHCKAGIAWHHNLPIVSWLWLRGRCARCRQPIAARYPFVELLTASLFLSVWLQHQDDWVLAFPSIIFPQWIFIALLIVATFIDFDYFIIPDEVTSGGTIAGMLFSFAIPPLMGVESHAGALVWSLVGAGVGYATLRAVVELGKLAFGRKRVVLPQVEDFTWTRQGADDAELVMGAETDRWSDLFSREKDELVLECERLTLAGHEYANATLSCYYDRVIVGEETFPLEKLETFSGRLREYTFPREAMGLGDVKFIACIGAFLGWKAVFFTVASSSLIGSVVGVALLLAGPKARSLKIPFGPYLSLGALIWLFFGPELIRWYLGLMQS